MARLEDILQSPWPIFQVLHLMSLMRQSDHDALLDPEHLEACRAWILVVLDGFRGLNVEKSIEISRIYGLGSWVSGVPALAPLLRSAPWCWRAGDHDGPPSTACRSLARPLEACEAHGLPAAPAGGAAAC